MQTDSILNTTKKLLGIGKDQTDFDIDVIIHINAVFSILSDLGVGPENGFSITDESTQWSEYTQDEIVLEKVKTYMYLKVRLYFDPPTNSTLLESMTNLASEMEWRLNVNVDTKKDSEG